MIEHNKTPVHASLRQQESLALKNGQAVFPLWERQTPLPSPKLIDALLRINKKIRSHQGRREMP
jgi:hypothetical protein